jgi:hypothetical protein
LRALFDRPLSADASTIQRDLLIHVIALSNLGDPLTMWRLGQVNAVAPWSALDKDAD